MADELYGTDDSSGFLTHLVGRVKTSFWSNMFAESQGKATQDFAQNTMLFWDVQVLDILQANYETGGVPLESIQVNFGIGNGWHPDPANPNLVEHEDDSENHRKKFHANSNYGKLIDIVGGKMSDYPNALVLDGDGDIGVVDLGGVRAIHAKIKATTTRDASIWNNMIFEFRGLGFKSRNVDTPRARPLPVHYMGYDESDNPNVEGLNSTPNLSEASASNGSTVTPEIEQVWTAGGAEPATITTLSKLWANAASPDEFVGNAKLLPAVKSNENLQGAVALTAGTFFRDDV